MPTEWGSTYVSFFLAHTALSRLGKVICSNSLRLKSAGVRGSMMLAALVPRQKPVYVWKPSGPEPAAMEVRTLGASSP